MDVVKLVCIGILIVVVGVLLGYMITCVSTLTTVGVSGAASLSDSVDHYGTPHWLTSGHLAHVWLDALYPEFGVSFWTIIGLMPALILAYVGVVLIRKLVGV